MTTNFDTPEMRQEILKFELQQKILELVRSNSNNLATIAQILGAEKFITITQIKGQAPVTSLDVSGFITDLQATNNLHDLKLPERLSKLNRTILPPDVGEIITGSGAGIEKKKIIPRSRYLMEILADLNLSYTSDNGTNDPNMMRGLSYVAFTIPEINTLILVNDEENNATFVIHNVNEDTENNRDFFIGLTKDQIKTYTTEKVAVVRFDKTATEWKEEITKLLVFGPQVEKKQTENKIDNEEIAPEGWMTKYELEGITKRDYSTINRYAKQFKSENPDWFKPYTNKKTKKFSEHYHPDLVKKIEEYFGIREKAPEGWETKKGIGKKIKRAEDTIQRHANQFRNKHPEWFKPYDDILGRNTEHYHPDLVKLIETSFSTREKVPEGWMNLTELEYVVHRERKTISNFTLQFRTVNPEWFKFYENEYGHFAEYLHPDLVRLIEKNLKK